MNIGILLWNHCNARCAHCAVNSGPEERPELTDAEIHELIEAAFDGGAPPSIGLSGGEAFLHYDRLCEFIDHIVRRGGTVSINTNGFWGTSESTARARVRDLKRRNVSQLVVSIDEFHASYIEVEKPLTVIRACKEEHLAVQLQFVSTRGTMRLADLLAEHADALMNVNCREIPCHPVGRAESVPRRDLFLKEGIPNAPCPSSVLSVSADGRFIPCCNTAGHLPALELGKVGDDINSVKASFKSDAVLQAMRVAGPQIFLPAATAAGYEVDDGYIDQCHLCYTLFRDTQVAEAIKADGPAAIVRAQEQVYYSSFKDALDRNVARRRRIPVVEASRER